MINSKRILTFSCLFCTKNYINQSYKVVMHVETRKNIMKDKKALFVCLKILQSDKLSGDGQIFQV